MRQQHNRYNYTVQLEDNDVMKKDTVCALCFKFFYQQKWSLVFLEKDQVWIFKKQFQYWNVFFNIFNYLILIAVASEHNHIKGMSLKL